MDTFLLHCYFEWNIHFMYANNLAIGVLDLLVCLGRRAWPSGRALDL